MADEVVESHEFAEVVEGWVSIDYEHVPDVRKQGLRRMLLTWFEPTILRALDNNGVVVGKVTVARCKKCQALLRDRAGQLVSHAEWHQRLEHHRRRGW